MRTPPDNAESRCRNHPNEPCACDDTEWQRTPPDDTTEGTAAWWRTQDCEALYERLKHDMEHAEYRHVDAYLDAALAVLVPAVRSRDEEIERLRERLGQYELDERQDALATAGAFDEEDPF